MTTSSAMYVVWNVSVFTVAPFFLKTRDTETSKPPFASCDTQPGLSSWIVFGDRKFDRSLLPASMSQTFVLQKLTWTLLSTQASMRTAYGESFFHLRSTVGQLTVASRPSG